MTYRVRCARRRELNADIWPPARAYGIRVTVRMCMRRKIRMNKDYDELFFDEKDKEKYD